MNLSLSNKTFKEPRKLIILLVIAVSLILVSLRLSVTRVTANIFPVIVHEENLAFGTVFPGEELQGDFEVHYAYEQGGITYIIILKRKPLPEGHPEYPDGGDPEMPGFYRDLCPSLTVIKVKEGTEEDTTTGAYVGIDDLSDAWIIYFKVPAIFGHVAQDHIGGVVSESGDYGCDISIDIEEG